MLKIYYNEDCNSDYKAHVVISHNSIKATISVLKADQEQEQIGEHDIAIGSYNSYGLFMQDIEQFHNSVANRVVLSKVKFVHLNRFAYAIRTKYTEVENIIGGSGVMQLDTGLVNTDCCDMLLRLFRIKRENFTIESDMEYEFATFSPEEFEVNHHHRWRLWDRYAVMVDGSEYMSDQMGMVKNNTTDNRISVSGREFIEITIQKYSADFSEKHARFFDTEDIVLETSGGILNTQRVWLQNGASVVRLYPLGYRGKLKLKIGWRWYPVLCEYNLELVE